MVDYRDTFNDIGIKPQSKQEWLEVLRETHGDIEDSKTTLLFIAEEEGFEVDSEDIEVVTSEPPTSTFT